MLSSTSNSMTIRSTQALSKVASGVLIEFRISTTLSKKPSSLVDKELLIFELYSVLRFSPMMSSCNISVIFGQAWCNMANEQNYVICSPPNHTKFSSTTCWHTLRWIKPLKGMTQRACRIQLMIIIHLEDSGLGRCALISVGCRLQIQCNQWEVPELI